MLVSIFSLSITFSGCKDNDTENSDNTTIVADENSDNTNSDNNSDSDTKITSSKVQNITTEEFKVDIFDYMASSEWKYNGTLPCVIDFYADWCGPCKQVAPIMDELAEEYAGKILFYKLDVDAEGEVASIFGVQSIPSILYIPANGQPQMSVGAMDKEGYKNAIAQVLNVE